MRLNFHAKLISLMLCFLPTWALAQTFPDRPIKVVVPFAPGNTLDNALRQVAEEFKKKTTIPTLQHLPVRSTYPLFQVATTSGWRRIAANRIDCLVALVRGHTRRKGTRDTRHGAQTILNAASSRMLRVSYGWGHVKCVYSERAVTVP